jgi:hypothetical protein
VCAVTMVSRHLVAVACSTDNRMPIATMIIHHIAVG